MDEEQNETYNERNSKIGISAVPKSRDSTIAHHLIFLILGDVRSSNRKNFRISPNPIFESRSVYTVQQPAYLNFLAGTAASVVI